MNVEQMIENMNSKNFNLVRQFTIQALHDTFLLTLSIQNLQRMQKQFNAQFNRLFKGSHKVLEKSMQIKLDAINKSDEESQIWTRADFLEKVEDRLQQG